MQIALVAATTTALGLSTIALRQAQTQTEAPQPQNGEIRLQLIPKDSGPGVQRTYELSIQMEQPLPKDATRITIPAPTARGVQRQSGHVAVEVMGNAEVKPGDGTTAVREDVRELPPDIFAGQSTPILLAFNWLDGPLTATLDIQRR